MVKIKHKILSYDQVLYNSFSDTSEPLNIALDRLYTTKKYQLITTFKQSDILMFIFLQRTYT
jgi:hypothetical protein